MGNIRVLVTSLSAFGADVVRRVVASQPDMEIVDDYVDAGTLLTRTASDVADVVIVGSENQQIPALVAHLLDRQPPKRLLILEEGAGTAILFELRPQPVRLGVLSGDALADSIRQGSAPENG